MDDDEKYQIHEPALLENVTEARGGNCLSIVANVGRRAHTSVSGHKSYQRQDIRRISVHEWRHQLR
jgi:3-dehydroquinate dehydratase